MLGNETTLISNVATVYALNLYAFCISNPLAVIIAASTFMPSLDFYYNGEYKTWWEKWGNWLLLGIGIAATVIACIAAPFTCGASTPIAAIGLTLAQIALGTAIGAAVSLAIGGTIAGIQGALTGHGFWNSFGDSISENWVDAVITSFAFTAVTVAVSNLVQTRCCFKEGTLVETSEGLKPIEEIEAGDEVLAYDEETGTQAYKPVVRLFRNETKVWYHIYVNGEEIICTGGHPFYVIDAAENTRIKGKWITASELEICDKLLLSDGTYAIIQSIGIEALIEPETTYNFEVADSHTYYVSKSNVLVHNKCTIDNNEPSKMANRGSTGRTEANNLVEKLAMEQVKSDPLNGSKVLNKIVLNDKRWSAGDGWVKMQTVVNSGSHQTTIHFVYNQTLNLVDDFKFVNFKSFM